MERMFRDFTKIVQLLEGPLSPVEALRFGGTSESEEYRRVVVDVSSTNEEILRLLKNEPDLVWKLPPRKFEEIVAEILDRQGYQIELTPASGDGGFDIYAARKDGLGRFLYLVECKRYVPPNKVGVP